MCILTERLDKIYTLLNDIDFLEGRGLANEVNIRIFCYPPEEEMTVQYFIEHLLLNKGLPCHLIEKNVYKVFLEICKNRRILESIEKMEKNKGKDVLYAQLQKSINVNAYVEQICKESFKKGDILLLTGIGDAFPFMRIHTLLEALQPKTATIPILVMYPGSFDGRNVQLFNKLSPNPYYRAFNII